MYLDISGGWIAGGFKEGAGREQREVVGNVNDDTDKELLKQVGNAMHTGLGEFNAVGHDEEVLVEVVNVI